MSFRDFTPSPNGNGRLELLERDNKNINNRSRWQGPTQQNKSSLRRTTSNTNDCTATNQRLGSTLPLTRSRSDLISYDDKHCGFDGDGGGGGSHSLQLVHQREEEYALRVMQQREQELLDIHRKMHVVDEIYKDLGEIVGQQQEMIDEVENQFQRAEESTRRGLEQIEKANKKYDKRKKKGESSTGDDEKLVEGMDKNEQFFVFAYLSKKASEFSRLMSACVGSGSVDYVNGECCKSP